MSDIISPMPRSFPRQLKESLLRSEFSSAVDLQRLCAVLEVFPYNTPVVRFGRNHHGVTRIINHSLLMRI
jgi:hypothetical protein